MPRFEGNFSGYLTAFLDAHPEWRSESHITSMADPDRGGPEEPWIKTDLLRAATQWARQQRYISWEMVTSAETLCRQMEHHGPE